MKILLLALTVNFSLLAQDVKPDAKAKVPDAIAAPSPAPAKVADPEYVVLTETEQSTGTKNEAQIQNANLLSENAALRRDLGAAQLELAQFKAEKANLTALMPKFVGDICASRGIAADRCGGLAPKFGPDGRQLLDENGKPVYTITKPAPKQAAPPPVEAAKADAKK